MNATQMRLANERWFTAVKKDSSSFLWKDKKHYYPIEERNGTRVFVAKTDAAFNDIAAIVTATWLKTNVVRA